MIIFYITLIITAVIVVTMIALVVVPGRRLKLETDRERKYNHDIDHPEESIPRYKKILEKNSKSFKANKMLAFIIKEKFYFEKDYQIRVEKLKESNEYAEKATTLTKNRKKKAKLYYLQGIIYNSLAIFDDTLTSGDTTYLEKAIEKIRASIQLTPKNYEAYLLWARMLIQKNKKQPDKDFYPEAFEKFEKACNSGSSDRCYTISEWGKALCEYGKIKKNKKYYLEGFDKMREAKKSADMLLGKNSAGGILKSWADCLVECATLFNDDSLFLESFDKYEAAIAAYPTTDCNSYYHWGNTLFQYATIKDDNLYFEKSMSIYDKAFETDEDRMFYREVKAEKMLIWAKKRKDETLYLEALDIYNHISKTAYIKEADEYFYYDWAEGLQGLARIKKDPALYHDALGKLKKAKTLAPSSYYTHMLRTVVTKELADLTQDIEIFRECLQLCHHHMKRDTEDKLFFVISAHCLLEITKLENKVNIERPTLEPILMAYADLGYWQPISDLLTLYALLDEEDNFFLWLDKTLALCCKDKNSVMDEIGNDYDSRNDILQRIESDTIFDKLRLNPRFKELSDKYKPSLA